MTHHPGESLNWTDVDFKGQEEFMRRWSEMASQATQGATTGASAFGANPFGGAGFGGPAFGGQGSPNWFAMFQPQFMGPAGDLAKRYFGFYDQYLAATRAFSEVLTKSMVNRTRRRAPARSPRACRRCNSRSRSSGRSRRRCSACRGSSRRRAARTSCSR